LLAAGNIVPAIQQVSTGHGVHPTQQNAPPASDLAGQLTAIEIQKMGGGPPVGKDIAVEITGKSLAELEKVAEEFKGLLSQVAGVEDIDDDFLDGKPEIRLRVNEERASRAGLSVFQVAQAVNTAYQGTVATSITRPEEEVDIRVRFIDEYRNNPNSLNQIFVNNQRGNLIPVSTIASFERATGISVVNHIDGTRLITVTANVDENTTTAVAATAQIRELARDLPAKYPGYKIVYSGQNKDVQESLRSLARAFGVAVFIIFMILASLFRSLIMPAVVLTAIPFALIGVIVAFFLHGEPLSFMAILGIIGLGGVVVNDSIVLVDFANRIRDARPELSNREVAVEAGAMRLRAVILTSITTVAGLLPTAYGIGGYDPFIVPMALAFAWGLLFATILTLVLIPLLYSQVLDWKDFVNRRLPGRLRIHEKIR
jgi:multidrug efflux pump subunit AcrB